uniref:DNA-directed RNA polymerase n=1 Tax=Nephromyces sp. ex Molgula occidentalis TaxID=2544991 RepID=A0A5C1H801_9APIC|nr:plastid-encoded DNA-directed RNA polymerase beta''B [Nephromyces sp. ex Molgula occidentalis]
MKLIKTPFFYPQKINNNISYNKPLIPNYFKFFNFKTKIKEVLLKFKYDNYEVLNSKTSNYFINFLNKYLTIIDNKYYKLLNFNNILNNTTKPPIYINNSYLVPKHTLITNLHKNIIPLNKSYILSNTKISSKFPKEKEINIQLSKYLNKYNSINNFYNLNISNSVSLLFSTLKSPKKSSDIISGLQYIETIFESKIKSYNWLIINTGYLIEQVSYNNYDELNNLFINKLLILNDLNNYSISTGITSKINSFFLEPTSIISGGSISLYESSYNPVLLLDLKFKTLLNYFNQFKATKISFNFIFNIIIESLYTQYISNNINIPLIHFEILTKKMTSWVKIIHTGNSSFKIGDILPLTIIHLTNFSYILYNKNSIIYKPIILGISRSVLASSGFLTAASFQQTLKILINATLENQIDWLVDLKAKLILSDLISTGSGWYRFFNKS